MDKPIKDNTQATLVDLSVGQVSYVTGIRINGLLRRRLLDLGFVPGAEVEAALRSPAGDPIVYSVRGARVALRGTDAAEIEVSTTPPAKNGNSCADATACSCSQNAENGSHPATSGSSAFYVALAGNPNTGKSTVFNALTGLRQHVGNWPGKTVARAEGAWNYKNHRFQLVDLPGTYSLLSSSTDEEIARDYLVFGGPDCTVVVVDATCLERNLNLVFQILEITDRVVVCVNLLDEARRKKVRIDLGVLEDELGVPVIGTAARSGEGLKELKDKILAVSSGEISPAPKRIPLEPELQQAVDDLLPHIERAFPQLPNARWIALRLIDGGDSRLREEIEHGVLAHLAGRIGEESLGGRMSPAAGVH